MPFARCVFRERRQMCARRRLQQSHESVIKYSTNLMRSFFSARINTEHGRKSHAMLKPFSDISFTLHSETVREMKKTALSLAKL